MVALGGDRVDGLPEDLGDRHLGRAGGRLRKGACVGMHLLVGVSPEWVAAAGDPHDVKRNRRVKQLLDAAILWAQSALGGGGWAASARRGRGGGGIEATGAATGMAGSGWRGGWVPLRGDGRRAGGRGGRTRRGMVHSRGGSRRPGAGCVGAARGRVEPVRMNRPGVKSSSTARRTKSHEGGYLCHSSMRIGFGPSSSTRGRARASRRTSGSSRLWTVLACSRAVRVLPTARAPSTLIAGRTLNSSGRSRSSTRGLYARGSLSSIWSGAIRVAANRRTWAAQAYATDPRLRY